MKMLKKFLVCLLILALTLSLFVACGDDTDGGSTGGNSDGSSGNQGGGGSTVRPLPPAGGDNSAPDQEWDGLP